MLSLVMISLSGSCLSILLSFSRSLLHLITSWSYSTTCLFFVSVIKDFYSIVIDSWASSSKPDEICLFSSAAAASLAIFSVSNLCCTFRQNFNSFFIYSSLNSSKTSCILKNPNSSSHSPLTAVFLNIFDISPAFTTLIRSNYRQYFNRVVRSSDRGIVSKVKAVGLISLT